MFEIGDLALRLSLVVCLFGFGAGIGGGLIRDERWTRLSERGLTLVFVFVSIATGAPLTPGHIVAVGLTAVELAVIVAVATLFSAFTTPMLASFFSVGIWALGHLTRDLRDIGASSASAAVKNATALLHRVMPDLESFNFSTEAAHGLAFAASDVWLPLLYGMGYVTVLLVAAIGIFDRRDLR